MVVIQLSLLSLVQPPLGSFAQNKLDCWKAMLLKYSVWADPGPQLYSDGCSVHYPVILLSSPHDTCCCKHRHFRALGMGCSQSPMSHWELTYAHLKSGLFLTQLVSHPVWALRNSVYNTLTRQNILAYPITESFLCTFLKLVICSLINYSVVWSSPLCFFLLKASIYLFSLGLHHSQSSLVTCYPSLPCNISLFT